MNNDIPSPAPMPSYTAWLRMRTETLALQRGTPRPPLSLDQPHVAAYLAARAEYLAALHAHGHTREGRAAAHAILMRAESRYLDHVIAELNRE